MSGTDIACAGTSGHYGRVFTVSFPTTLCYLPPRVVCGTDAVYLPTHVVCWSTVDEAVLYTGCDDQALFVRSVRGATGPLVLSLCMALRVSASTEYVYGATRICCAQAARRWIVDSTTAPHAAPPTRRSQVPSVWYSRSYGGTSRAVLAYAAATRCAVRAYAVCGTELGYGATVCHAESSTELRYGATVCCCAVC
eukprot:2702707-Rhodomonas_salina.1